MTATAAKNPDRDGHLDQPFAQRELLFRRAERVRKGLLLLDVEIPDHLFTGLIDPGGPS